jgi:hypothetical protein
MFDDIYGGKNNRAWQRHLYLQGKAREVIEARRKQVAEAEARVRGLKQINENRSIGDKRV